MGTTAFSIGSQYAVPDWDDLPDGMEQQQVVDEIHEAQTAGVWLWWKARGEPLGLLGYAPDVPSGFNVGAERILNVDGFQVGIMPAITDDGPEESLVLRFNGRLGGMGPLVGYQVSIPAADIEAFAQYVATVERRR